VVVALVFVALVGAALSVWAHVIQRRQRDVGHVDATQTVKSMARTWRFVFGVAGIAAVVGGLIVSSPELVLFGLALLLSAIAQQWVYGSWGRR